MVHIQNAVIPIAGLGTRFLPISRVIPKEFLPLGDKPLLHHAVQELKDSGITRCNFIVRPGQHRDVVRYFSFSSELEKFLRTKKRDHLVPELKKVQELKSGLSFSFVTQKIPSGNAKAIVLALRNVGQEPCAVLFPDDIIISKTPCLAQLIKVFRTAQKPIIALARVSRERISQYGAVEAERIAHRFYKIKRIVEKPSPDTAPSDLAIIGRYVLTQEAFEHLKRFEKLTLAKQKSPAKEFSLTDVLGTMIREGKTLYGYEVEGEWLECGTKEEWMHSFLSYLVRHSEQRNEIKQYLRKIL